MNDELKQLFQEMADLTLPKCKQCRVPLSCCSPEYCGMALDTAKEHGIALKITDHPTLPLMGANGCTAPPYLRPLCTLHVCSINDLGCDPKDPVWTGQYFELRDKIGELQWL
jgi:hypothetical protein